MKLKICGVKSVREAQQLRDTGVDLIGLNFIPSSPRCISIEMAEVILAELKGSNIQSVALFAGKSVEEVNDYASRLQVNYVQLHGNEPASYAKAVESPVIRAIAVDPIQPAGELIEFMSKFPADYFVLDRQKQGRGEPVDAELAAQIIVASPAKVFLAGGLNPDNLAATLVEASPYGIDIAGGIRDQDDNLDISQVEKCLQVIAT